MNIEEIKELQKKAERSLKHALSKITKLEKALEEKEKLPEQGQLCYFWDDVRPRYPIVRPFHSKIPGLFFGGNGDSWKHCEPIPRQSPWIPVENGERPKHEGLMAVKLRSGRIRRDISDTKEWYWGEIGTCTIVAYIPLEEVD